MLAGLASYAGGAIAGFAMGMLAMLAFLPEQEQMVASGGDWVALNMGHSVWLFGIVLICYCANLYRLRNLLAGDAAFRRVAQLDQLSDVWTHLFIGIGVVWTAIGMRSALATTLNMPDTLTDNAGEVLSRLVDGGILLALTTTIVGAIGGYLMRLFKTMLLGAALTEYYHRIERDDLRRIVRRLDRLEGHLQQLTSVYGTAGANVDEEHACHA